MAGKCLKRVAWIRRHRVLKMKDEPLPKTVGGMSAVIGWRLVRETEDGLQYWEAYGWKPYDATLYRLSEYDPANCPAEAVPAEIYTENLKLLVKGRASAYLVSPLPQLQLACQGAAVS
ncbi:MAG TPA: hypothetical protein DEA47_00600 [Peptococcaceae bacterium]|nr:MAG: hypothetical protein XD50_0433 [Clostridia bacterium 41_269]HBT19868.1 hypothetical protein [Peptococcaceae bacterium]